MEFEEEPEPEIEDKEPDHVAESQETENGTTDTAITTEKARESVDNLFASEVQSENKEEPKKEESVYVPEATQAEPERKVEAVSQPEQPQEHAHEHTKHVHEHGHGHEHPHEPVQEQVQKPVEHSEVPTEQPGAHAVEPPAENPVEHPLAHQEEHSTQQSSEQPVETQSQPTEQENPIEPTEKSSEEPKSLVDEVHTILSEKNDDNDWDEDTKIDSKPSDNVGANGTTEHPTEVPKPESTAAVSDNDESKVADTKPSQSDPLGNLWGNDENLEDPFGVSTTKKESKRDKKKKLEEQIEQEEKKEEKTEEKNEEKKDDKKGGFGFSAAGGNDIFGTADENDLFS